MQTAKIDALLLDVQKELETVIKDGENPHFKSSYATFNAVIDTVKKPLNSRGILIEQIPDCDEFGRHVKTVLLHVESGEKKSCKVYLELPKPDMQKVGSAITYAKRYGLQTLCVLPSEDDDGNDAAGLSKGASNQAKGGFSGTKVTKKATKKVAAKKADPVKKEEVKVSPKIGGFGSQKTQTNVTKPPATGGFGSKKVTPPPTFDNKPSFGSRSNKPEPAF